MRRDLISLILAFESCLSFVKESRIRDRGEARSEREMGLIIFFLDGIKTIRKIKIN